MSPFFSVCIPSNNRSATIYNTLYSLAKQTFRDFEVIIGDCGSTDITRKVIDDFLNSNDYKNNPFTYQLIYKDNIPETVEDWNVPVEKAKGKYIAMLEGDDQFLPEHLSIAHSVLSKNPNIGIYATGNQEAPRRLTGSVSSNIYFKYLYSLQEVPPPSETIFIRCNKQGQPYFYNDNDFVYAPEIDLYLRICNDGFNAHLSDRQMVWRLKELKSRAKWKYYVDHFAIIEKYKNFPGITNQQIVESRKSINKRAYLGLLYDKFIYKTKERFELQQQLRRKDSTSYYFNFVYYSLFILVRAIKRKLLK